MPSTKKRRIRLSYMENDPSTVKLDAVAQALGREICVFRNPAASETLNGHPASYNEEPDDFYDFTSDDYFRVTGEKIGAQSQILKTRKMREAETAARRARITKAVIRIQFPDNYILEAKFHTSEKIKDLMGLLKQVLAQPDLPFYLYTTPPKALLKDMTKDMYSAGFVPGAIVYFSSEVPDAQGPYLREDILALTGMEALREIHIESEPEPVSQESVEPAPLSPLPEPKPDAKKPAKPKWLKL